MYIVDEIIDDIARIEDVKEECMINVELSLLPKDVKEKDVLKKIDDKYVLDIKEKEDRLKRIKEKMDKLKRRG